MGAQFVTPASRLVKTVHSTNYVPREKDLASDCLRRLRSSGTRVQIEQSRGAVAHAGENAIAGTDSLTIAPTGLRTSLVPDRIRPPGNTPAPEIWPPGKLPNYWALGLSLLLLTIYGPNCPVLAETVVTKPAAILCPLESLRFYEEDQWHTISVLERVESTRNAESEDCRSLPLIEYC